MPESGRNETADETLGVVRFLACRCNGLAVKVVEPRLKQAWRAGEEHHAKATR